MDVNATAFSECGSTGFPSFGLFVGGKALFGNHFIMGINLTAGFIQEVAHNGFSFRGCFCFISTIYLYLGLVCKG